MGWGGGASGHQPQTKEKTRRRRKATNSWGTPTVPQPLPEEAHRADLYAVESAVVNVQAFQEVPELPKCPTSSGEGRSESNGHAWERGASVQREDCRLSEAAFLSNRDLRCPHSRLRGRVPLTARWRTQPALSGPRRCSTRGVAMGLVLSAATPHSSSPSRLGTKLQRAMPRDYRVRSPSGSLAKLTNPKTMGRVRWTNNGNSLQSTGLCAFSCATRRLPQNIHAHIQVAGPRISNEFQANAPRVAV